MKLLHRVTIQNAVSLSLSKAGNKKNKLASNYKTITMNRRNFLQQSTLTGTGLLLSSLNTIAMAQTIQLPADFDLKILATNWGYSGTWDSFCSKVKTEGYDGVELWLPGDEKDKNEMMDAIKKYNLNYGFLCAGHQADFTSHFETFKKNLKLAMELKPLYINCHSGRDYFSFEDNKKLIEYSIATSKETGVPVYHETHRSRILFAAHIAKQFIEKIPGLRLTLDISHWCNVHESLLADQEETVNMALQRADHIHARIGHQEGPQVNDPRAPEWEKTVAAHLNWWDKIVENKIKTGNKKLTILTEFGPPNYLPTLPYTQQPVADRWAINVHMMNLLRKRYKS